jgi:hypothetical protein
MLTIAWITDVPGWAYDNRARTLARHLPAYQHRFVCYPSEGFADLRDASVIVCPDPRVLPCFCWRANVVQHVNAMKIFA